MVTQPDLQRHGTPGKQRDLGSKAAPTDKPERNRRYGEPWLDGVATLTLGGLSEPRRLAGLAIQIGRRPTLLQALVALLLETPKEIVQVSASASGKALEEYFDERFLGVIPRNRVCRGVLLLPADHALYLRGRHRQALRTNLRHAAFAQVRCEQCLDPEAALEALREILAARRRPPNDAARLMGAWERSFAGPEPTVLVARGPSDRALAVIAAVIDRRVALIRFAVASNHAARWALHDHLVRTLIDRRVRYLLAEGGGPFGALGFGPELQHYQRLLGYELRHLVASVEPVASAQSHESKPLHAFFIRRLKHLNRLFAGL